MFNLYELVKKKTCDSFILWFTCMYGAGLFFFVSPGCQSNSSIKRGEALARVHCAGCHQFPDPDLLDRRTWQESILPEMGLYLGIIHAVDTAFLQRLKRKFFEGDYPKKAVLTGQEWADLTKFYLYSSKEYLEIPERKPVLFRSDFELVPIYVDSIGGPPAVTAVKVDESSRLAWIADQNSGLLGAFDAVGNEISSFGSPMAVGNISIRKEKTNQTTLVLTAVGFSLQPDESNNGYIEEVTIDASNTVEERRFLMERLNRPVFSSFSDLTNDSIQELVVCHFGNREGELAIYGQSPQGTWDKNFSYDVAGAISLEILDFNHDGWKDIVVLFAQGAEKIVLFKNTGNFIFETTELMTFPPSYGSTSLQLADFNADGSMDILYSCGDNADLSPVLKPYHGIYVFVNNGNDVFEKKFFYPFNGAYKAVARDFNSDGALDIAAISYFADYTDLEEHGFVLLENEGFPNFSPTSLPVGKLGRWISMDTGDIDGDGDIDILLGNYSAFYTKVERNSSWVAGSHALLLKNKTMDDERNQPESNERNN
nr:hypothetical protein [Cytophagales bacterium]